MNQKKFTLGLLGAIASAVVTSGALLVPACCAGPIIFAALGIGAASLSNLESLFAYRWILYGVTMLFVATAFHQTYLNSKVDSCKTAAPHTKTMQIRKILFWTGIILVLILISFPYLFEKVLLRLR